MQGGEYNTRVKYVEHKPARRRWYQLGLGEYLLLTTLLGVIWWQCATRPAIKTLGPGSKTAPGGGVLTWSSMTIERRPPPVRIVAYRGAVCTVGALVAWIAVATAIRRVARRSEMRQ
jgi:hypothetical protein